MPLRNGREEEWAARREPNLRWAMESILQSFLQEVTEATESEQNCERSNRAAPAFAKPAPCLSLRYTARIPGAKTSRFVLLVYRCDKPVAGADRIDRSVHVYDSVASVTSCKIGSGSDRRPKSDARPYQSS